MEAILMQSESHEEVWRPRRRPAPPPISRSRGPIVEALDTGKSLKTIHRRTNPVDDAEVDAGFRMIEKRWKLFRYDAKKRRWLRILLNKKETSEQFKARVLGIIDAELAVLWIMAEITKGLPAPHSNADFAGEIGRNERTVRRCIRNIVEDEYIVGFVRGSRRPALWVRPDDDAVIYNLDNRYNRVGEDPRYRMSHTHLLAQRRDTRGF
jgi:hypothetical protein